MRTYRRFIGSAATSLLLVVGFAGTALAQDPQPDECYPVPVEGCVPEDDADVEPTEDVLPDEQTRDAPVQGAPEVAAQEDQQLAASGVDSGILALSAAGALALGGAAVAGSRRRSR